MAIKITPSESNPGAFALAFDNPQCPHGGRCIIHVVKGEPRAPFHGWNGDMERPTVTPSIGCDGRGGDCKWHGFITDGKVTP